MLQKNCLCQGAPIAWLYYQWVYTFQEAQLEHAGTRLHKSVSDGDSWRFFLERCSTLAEGGGSACVSGEGKHQRAEGTLCLECARCSHLKTVHTRRPAQDERSRRVTHSEAMTPPSEFDYSSTVTWPWRAWAVATRQNCCWVTVGGRRTAC